MNNIIYKKTSEYDTSNSKIDLDDSILSINDDTENNNINTINKKTTNITPFDINNFINNFINYMKSNNYGHEYIDDNMTFSKIINLYIKENDLNEIESFENIIKNKSFIRSKIANLKRIENYDNLSNLNSNINNEQNTTLSKLANNDINTWLFIGIILLSFTIIIMMIIK